MKVLIIGVNGFIGRAVAARLVANGIDVFGLSRSENPSCIMEATYLVGDRNSPASVREIVAAKNIDGVVDVLAMTHEETQALLLELDGQIGQYVMLSSSDVYRNYELLHRKIEGTPIAGSVDEQSPLRRTRYPYRSEPRRAADDPERYLDEYDKIPIEEAVQRLRTAWTILRLPMVYGPGDRQRRFRWAIEPMAKREKFLVIPRAWASSVATYGYVQNVGAAIAATLGNSHAFRQVFNIAESKPANHFEWANRIASVMDWDGKIELVDDPSSSFARRLEGLDLTVPFKIDGRKIRNKLGYSELIDEEEGLKRTVFDEISRS